ncbi:MAG: hypothetical protein RQ729_06465 [Wenzhouxiangellaceae bacterium]|nr:hypothetical protein [Wenzhouxiangellaceae bacterium]
MLSKLSRNALALAMGGLLASSANAFVVNDSFSGNWSEQGVDAARGLIIDVVPPSLAGDPANDFSNNVLLQWFTYRDGEPVWLFGGNIASIDKNTNTAEIELVEFAGGAFGPEAGAPAPVPWGTATLTFESCNSATLDYDGIDGAGTLSLQNNTPSELCAVQREFDSCPSFATAVPNQNACIVQGTIEQDVTLTNETLWLLQGQVIVGEGTTLTIEPGTEVVGGTSGGVDFLVVPQGARIIAEGTPAAPIVMRGLESAGRGEWGGLVINGFAPINGCADDVEVCTSEGEGDSGLYGGNDPQDNSGVLRYLVVANAGFEFSPTNELNGIALQGVGAGTTVEYVQSHLGADDAIEPFGGTVNMRYLVLTGASDDSFDWTEGFSGNTQYVVVKQYKDAADRGIEADNNNGNNDSLPRSMPKLANFTIIGAEGGGRGITLRRGTAGNLANFIVTNAGNNCLDLDQDATFAAADRGELTISNSVIGACPSGVFADSAEDPFLVSAWFLDQAGNVEADPQLGGKNDLVPQAGSPAVGIGSVPFNDAFFDNVDYAGAFAPNGPDWTAGWTVGLDRDEP